MMGRRKGKEKWERREERGIEVQRGGGWWQEKKTDEEMKRKKHNKRRWKEEAERTSVG